jgi:hypothetical protein
MNIIVTNLYQKMHIIVTNLYQQMYIIVFCWMLDPDR